MNMISVHNRTVVGGKLMLSDKGLFTNTYYILFVGVFIVQEQK